MPTLDASARPRPRKLIIVPAFNEADSIVGVIEDLRRCVPDCDVLVVDDGSADDTATRARSSGGAVSVVTLPFNQGIGGAMQTGYRYAAIHGYDVAVQVDGDGQHPADQVPLVIDHLCRSNADLVIGSRFLPPVQSDATGERCDDQPDRPSADAYHPPPSRMVGIRLLRGLLRVLVGQRITDCTSGLRAANRGVIEAFSRWYPDDYPEPEVIVLLKRAGFTVEEVPVQMAARTAGQTSIPFFRGVFYVLKVSVALLLDMIRSPWPRVKSQADMA